MELDFGNTGFCGGRKTVELEEKASEQGEPTTDPTAYDTGPESKSGHMMNVVPRSTMNTNGGTEIFVLSHELYLFTSLPRTPVMKNE